MLKRNPWLWVCWDTETGCPESHGLPHSILGFYDIKLLLHSSPFPQLILFTKPCHFHTFCLNKYFLKNFQRNTGFSLFTLQNTSKISFSSQLLPVTGSDDYHQYLGYFLSCPVWTFPGTALNHSLNNKHLSSPPNFLSLLWIYYWVQNLNIRRSKYYTTAFQYLFLHQGK